MLLQLVEGLCLHLNLKHNRAYQLSQKLEGRWVEQTQTSLPYAEAQAGGQDARKSNRNHQREIALKHPNEEADFKTSFHKSKE